MKVSQLEEGIGSSVFAFKRDSMDLLTSRKLQSLFFKKTKEEIDFFIDVGHVVGSSLWYPFRMIVKYR